MDERRADESEYLVFQLDRWRYAIAAADAREVAPAVTVVPLPKAPRIVQGVIDLRGALVPVLDIRSRFGLPAKPLELADHLLVVSAEERVVALHVDCVIGLMRVPGDAIEDACRAVPASSYVAGVAKLPDGLVLIHDLATFLSKAEADALAAMEPIETAA
jgi:purine-binding chemotaxis protein CheW